MVEAYGMSSEAILRSCSGCTETGRSAGHMRMAEMNSLAFHLEVTADQVKGAVAWAAVRRRVTGRRVTGRRVTGREVNRPGTGEGRAAAFAPAATSSATWSINDSASRRIDGR